MIKGSYLSALVSMSTEAQTTLNGLEDQTYLNSFLESTGDEPQCLRTTHSSMYPLWSGYITLDQPLSSTHYQWRELYAAWKLATVSPNLQEILIFPQKGQPCTVPMVWPSWTRSWNLNLQTIANTTYIYANESLIAWSKDTPNPNCV